MKIIIFILIGLLLTTVIYGNEIPNIDKLENLISQDLGVNIEGFKVKIEVIETDEAFFDCGLNTIFLPKDYTDRILIHELTHAILQYNYPYALPEKMQEILAKYMEYQFRKSEKEK